MEGKNGFERCSLFGIQQPPQELDNDKNPTTTPLVEFPHPRVPRRNAETENNLAQGKNI